MDLWVSRLFHLCHSFWAVIHIAHVILNIMATYYESSCLGSLPFILVISHILVDTSFEIDQQLGILGLHVLINKSSLSQHVSHMFVSIALKVVQEEEEIYAMEQDPLVEPSDEYLKPILRRCKSHESKLFMIIIRPLYLELFFFIIFRYWFTSIISFFSLCFLLYHSLVIFMTKTREIFIDWLVG